MAERRDKHSGGEADTVGAFSGQRKHRPDVWALGGSVVEPGATVAREEGNSHLAAGSDRGAATVDRDDRAGEAARPV